ncbi:ABC transporter permease [Planomicrobium sp. CPCC 101079]|uniref:ABC transporter permease n=1 Tax=Planomicrobium sp. CPCC 101079 TaxID=2599618 RepID=UPI0011B83AD1|nr:ABC transporter permease subunit [Planomicrobium sp. CPCC 101079]TWT03467.1 ABC transporter permease subunit [Planomicrobium sp. CPCC 101079]
MWKQPYFVIGFAILAFFLIGSFAYEWFWGNVPRQVRFIMENGRAVEGAPISPQWAYPFGTDQFGFDMLGKLMIGAKYTIIAALAVAALRMLIAVPLGYMLGTYLQRHRSWVSGLADSLHYIPLTVFASFLLTPVLWMPEGGFTNTIWERIAIQVVVMALLTVPIVAVLVGSEAAILYQKEYIEASRILGASRLRIIRKHLIPHMREKLAVLYGQQVMETFIVLAHLGLLNLFLGGTKVSRDPMFGDPPMSISFEWSGLFGSSFRYLHGAPWMPLSPVLFIALSILAVSFMMEGYLRSKNPKVKKRSLSAKKEEVVNWNRSQLREKMVQVKDLHDM